MKPYGFSVWATAATRSQRCSAIPAAQKRSAKGLAGTSGESRWQAGVQPSQSIIATPGSGPPSVDASGNYTAGQNANSTDTLQIQDSLGNTFAFSVAVGPALSLSNVEAVGQPSPGVGSPATLPPSSTLILLANGGTGAYTFGISSNGSGATITPGADAA